jgi:hypothetical protein
MHGTAPLGRIGEVAGDARKDNKSRKKENLTFSLFWYEPDALRLSFFQIALSSWTRDGGRHGTLA